ncbi:glutamate--cysteine ligase [Coemansia erecta]|nr:glutamate--cysteine ligase [Coemansia erecta]
MDVNMERAHSRDAVLKEKFFFRRSYVATEDDDKVSFSSGESEGGEVAELTASEIVNGSPDFVGLVPIVEMYLDTVDMDRSVREKIGKYIGFIRGRANGSLMTLAAWMRDYVRSHPEYNFDSVVSPEINYDLVVALNDIACGRRSAPELFGEQ